MHKLTAIQLRDRFLNGEISAKEIASHFLGRIKRYDSDIGAFLNVMEKSLLAQAEALDTKKHKGEKLGKLAGIPIAIKDNIHIKGVITTCASRFLTNYTAPFSATVVALLEKEDALFIGKTNMDEFGMGSSTEHSAMFPTQNPWNLKCAPGGSSGGSAAAVAARFCPIALGSDTGGSIRQPASLCGITGFKPTYGRVSRFGLVELGSSLDQIGPLATNAKDAALIMEVIGQHCHRDSTSLDIPGQDFISAIDQGVEGMKIGVPWHLLEDLKGEAKGNFLAAAEALKTLGAEIVDVNLDLIKYSIPTYYIIMTAESSTNLARFDGVRYGRRSPHAKTLKDVYDLSKEEGFGQEVKRRILLGTYVLSAGFQDAFYKKAQKIRTLMIQQLQTAFSSCATIALPTTTGPAFEIGEITDPLQMYLNDLFTILANLTGIPAVSILSGFSSEGKPLGLQILGPQKQDPLVLQTAYAFEQAVNIHATLPPTINEVHTS